MKYFNLLLWWLQALSLGLAAASMSEDSSSNSEIEIAAASTPVSSINVSSVSVPSVPVSSVNVSSIDVSSLNDDGAPKDVEIIYVNNAEFEQMAKKTDPPLLDIVEEPSTTKREKRWMTIFKNHRQKWPRHANGKVYIRYCYADQQTKDQAKCTVENAFDIWATALGGKASPQTGHAIIATEAKDRNLKNLFCYEADGRTWNKYMPDDTLQIQLTDEYSQASGAWLNLPGQAGRHFLKIRREELNTPRGIISIAHEIGHVFGMGHEHQRSDRDQYILVQCGMVVGFNAAFAAAKTANPNVPETEIRKSLCTDWRYANNYGFTYAHMIDDENESEKSSNFDWDSIMLYSSNAAAQVPNTCLTDAKYCPLLKKNFDAATNKLYVTQYQGGQERSGKPSQMDVEFIKHYYPFQP